MAWLVLPELAQNQATLSNAAKAPPVQEEMVDELYANSAIENGPVVPARVKYSHSPSEGKRYPVASQLQ